jgi:type 1 glutamine amidotransferase
MAARPLRIVAVLGVGLLLAGVLPHALADQAAAFTALVFSKTAGYRHKSIPAGIEAIKALGEANGFRVDASESAALFTDENLARYRVVVFLNTTGDILDANQQAAFERFVRRGGAFVGIHSATDTEYDWPGTGGWSARTSRAIPRSSALS